MRVRLLFLLFAVYQGFVNLYGQDDNSDLLYNIHEYTREVKGEEPILQTGAYYEFPTFNVEGHPFIFADAFYNGSVVYKNRVFQSVKLKYDIHHQHLYVNHRNGKEYSANRLSNEFLTSFSIIGLEFKKIQNEQGKPGYYQVVADLENLGCYYAWFKSRSESHDGAYKKTVFSESKQRRYLMIEETLSRYKNNRSFVHLFPDDIRKQVKQYLKEHDLKVNQADEEKMLPLITHCNQLMDN